MRVIGSFCTGGNQVTQDKTQSYTPSAAGLNSLGAANTWLSQVDPSNAPLLNTNAPNYNQLGSYQGFGQTAENNPSNPYFHAGSDFLNQSVQAPDTQSFLNPYNQYQLQNWQQYAADPAMRNARTGAVGAAGGVGAERNALANQNAAFNTNQQLGGLLQGQWNSAAGQAQQQRQNQQAAGALNFAAAPQALNSQLAAFGAQQGSGNNMWGYQQLPNQAQYQQQEQQFQTPFQLAQMYSQMAPAYGGTQTGQQTTTYPQQSPFGQLAGLVGAGVGAYNTFFGGGSGSGGYGNSVGDWNPNVPGGRLTAKDGGRIGYAMGGQAWNPFDFDKVDPTQAPKSGIEQIAAGLKPKGYADGGDIEDELYGVRQTPASRIQGSFDQLGVPDRHEDVGSPPLPPEIASGQSPPIPRPRSASNSFAPEEEDAGIPAPMRQQEIPSPQGGSADQSMAGLPSLPQFNDQSSQLAKNPWAALMMGGLRAMQGGKRDSHGLLEGTNPLGQLGAAIGHGGEAGVNFLEKQREQNRAEEMAKFQAGMQQMPYKSETATQRRAHDIQERGQNLPYEKETLSSARGHDLQAERNRLAQEQFDAQYSKLTLAAKATVDHQLRADLLAREKHELDILKPFKMGMDPDTGLDIMGIRDPKSGEIKRWNPPSSEAEGEKKVAGLSLEALHTAAENYRQTGQFPPNLGRSPQDRFERKAILNKAQQLEDDAGGNSTEWPNRWQDFRTHQVALNRFNSGPTGNNIRGLNVAVDHMATLSDMIPELKNGNIVPLNKLAQLWAQQTGQPAPTNFDQARQIIGTEIIKALGVAGAGTVEERTKMADSFNRANSPAQLTGAIETAEKLLGGQLRGLRQQFTEATGRSPERFNNLLFPETREKLERWEKKKTGTKAELSGADKQALDWANSNPKDPRAVAIKKRLGVE